MKKTILRLITLLVFVSVGAVGTVVMQSSDKQPASSNKITTPKVINDYQNELDNLKVKNKELSDKEKELNSKLDAYSENESNNKVNYELLEKELFNQKEIYDIILGRTGVRGSGVEITMSDSDEEMASGDDIANYIIHDSTVLKIVNELKYAGAEVIAINGYPLSWDSNIKCAGPVIYIDDFIAGTPFQIQAIGDQQKMMATLEAEDSFYIELSRFSKINISLRKVDSIVLNEN